MKTSIKIISLLIFCTLLSTAFSNSYTVTSGLDSGSGTLREAWNLAISNSGEDTIIIDDILVTTITLSTTGFAFNKHLPSASELVLYGNGVTITSTIAGGFATLNGDCEIHDVIFDQLGGGTNAMEALGSNSGINAVINCQFLDSGVRAITVFQGELSIDSCDFNDSGDLAIYVDFDVIQLTISTCNFNNNGGPSTIGNALYIFECDQVFFSGDCTFGGTGDQEIALFDNPETPGKPQLNIDPTFFLPLGEVLVVNNYP